MLKIQKGARKWVEVVWYGWRKKKGKREVCGWIIPYLLKKKKTHTYSNSSISYIQVCNVFLGEYICIIKNEVIMQKWRRRGVQFLNLKSKKATIISKHKTNNCHIPSYHLLLLKIKNYESFLYSVMYVPVWLACKWRPERRGWCLMQNEMHFVNMFFIW